MSKPEPDSKFEQMRSRRHMLSNLPAKPTSKRDSNLIGGGNSIKRNPQKGRSVKPQKGGNIINTLFSTKLSYFLFLKF